MFHLNDTLQICLKKQSSEVLFLVLSQAERLYASADRCPDPLLSILNGFVALKCLLRIDDETIRLVPELCKMIALMVYSIN